MPLLEASRVYKPFEYPWAYDFWKRQQQLHWLPEEVPLGEDCRDWAQKLTDHERNLLTQIFRFFTQADVEVQDCYHDKYGRVFKPTEIKMMLTAFSNMETVHIAAYSHLLDTIGMPEIEYSAFLKYKEMKDKFDYMQNASMGSRRDIAKTMAMFGAFTEGLGFDGSAIEGFSRVSEADTVAKPDPSTFQVLPWRGERPSTARMFCSTFSLRKTDASCGRYPTPSRAC